MKRITWLLIDLEALRTKNVIFKAINCKLTDEFNDRQMEYLLIIWGEKDKNINSKRKLIKKITIIILFKMKLVITKHFNKQKVVLITNLHSYSNIILVNWLS